MPGKAVEIAIIGAGAAGLAIAWQLAKHGRPPHVFDARGAGEGAMTASGGMLSPAYEAEFEELPLLRAMLASRAHYPAWAAELGDIGYRTSGTYELALSAEDVPYVQRRVAFEQAQGLSVEWLEGEVLRKRLPHLSPRIPGGSFAPDEGHIVPEYLRDRLVEAAQKLGATFHFHTPVLRIEVGAKSIFLHTLQGKYEAETAVVCAGVPLEGLKLPFRVYPVRGQMIAIESPSPEWLPAPVRYFNRALGYGYAVPKPSYIILGGTAEERGADPSLTVGGLLDILRRAYYVFPDLYESRILRMWAGLRPATDTRLPLLHKVPSHSLYYVNGLYRNGILLAPLVGEGVTQWILEGQLPDLLLPFVAEQL